LLSHSHLPKGVLFFAQIHNSPGDPPNPVASALEFFCHLFFDTGQNHLIVFATRSTTSSRLFDLPLLDVLSEKLNKPVLVLGTLSRQDVVKHSWDRDGLGLNIFDLPWFSNEKEKVFRYIPLLSLPEHLTDLRRFFESDRSQTLSTVCEDAKNQLQWARCHKLNAKLKDALGHGQRDWLQAVNHGNVSDRLTGGIRNQYQADDLPCKGRCGLMERLQNLLDDQTIDDAESALRWKQKVAELSCGIYRLAQPWFAGGTESPARSIKFSRIIIVEDNSGTRDALKHYLKSYVHDPDDEIRLLEKEDIEQSVQAVRLLKNGKDLLKGVDERKTLVCFDLELDSKSRNAHIPDGLRLLYKTVKDHPNMPCIVVTGYRSQEHRSLGLRAGSFLLKPFTQDDVKYAVENAVRQWRVTWLYPEGVQSMDAEVIGKVFQQAEDIQERMQESVRSVLRDHLIDLDIEDSSLETFYGADRTDLSRSDLFILDIARLNLPSEACEEVGDALRKLLLSLRHFNPDAPVIIIWPFDRWKEMDHFLFGSLRRLFREGIDQVLYKPTWLSDDGESTEGLVGQVLHALQRPSFNVKFTVQLPIAPFIGRFDWNYVREAQSNEAKAQFAPFLVPLVKAFGLSAPLSVLKNMTGIPKRRLVEAIQSEITQNRNRWGGLGRNDAAINGLATFLLRGQPAQGVCSEEKEALRRRFDELIQALRSSSELQSYLTLEDWVRSRCRRAVKAHLSDVVRLFGGETRFELFARGSWIDKHGTQVEDLLIVVEFLANLSVVSREFVEHQVIQPLLEKYGEDAAILQEIPIRGVQR
jgi:CheY-like chemotaxis protein